MHLHSLFVSLLPALASASQVALNGWEQLPSTTSTTLVDVLSADPDYLSILKLCQRAKLIPLLNRINGSSFFAPTNDAIKRHRNALWDTVLQDDDFMLNDNIQEKLRQEIFYHLLNYTLPGLPTDENPQVLKTLHFPRTSVGPPSKEPPPSPPWMPVPGGTLGGEPQRLRLAFHDDSAHVGVDAFGRGGAKVVKGQVDAVNGIVIGVQDVLNVPLDLASIVSQQPSVSYFNKVLTAEITHLLNHTSGITLFLPIDSAWDALDPLERLYLESEFATDDLIRILNMHAVVEKGVTWSDSFGPAVNLTTVDGTNLEVVVSPERTMISSSTLVEPDIYASNGVLHLVDSLLVPPGALRLTPEKYLLALNCTSFVSLIHSANLTHLINDTDTEYTILAPRDDVLSVFGGPGELPDKGSEELKKLLMYHFIPGRWTPKKLQDGMMIETALTEQGLDGGKQVLEIEVTEEEGKKKGTKRVIRFGGVSTMDDPIAINNTLLYFVSRPLINPTDALSTILPELELSSFLAAIFSTSVADLIKETPRTTLLIPYNDAFKRLGLLVSAHLLSPSSKSDLKSVIMHHAIDGVEYEGPIRDGSQRTYATLEGSDLQLERSSSKAFENTTLLLSASGGWAGMKAEIYPRNLLTQTGVIHEISDILIPRSVNLTIGKLMKAAKGSTMINIVNKAGMDWVLNGTAPPEDSPFPPQAGNNLGWTLLCPTDDAFKGYNLTRLYADPVGLQMLVEQHMIPTPPSSTLRTLSAIDVLNNNRPLVLDDSATYSTLLSKDSAYGDIVFRLAEVNPPVGEDPKNPSYVVGIKGARGTNGAADWARVISWGRSTTGAGTGGVIQIDRLLVPYQPSWWFAYGGPFVFGAFGLAGIVGFFHGVRLIWLRDTTEATYEPVGGFGRDDEP